MEHDRKRLIQLLVLESFERVHACGHSIWMQTILEDGFIGFSNMSDEQLLTQCRRFGLSERRLAERLPLDDEPAIDETTEPLPALCGLPGPPRQFSE